MNNQDANSGDNTIKLLVGALIVGIIAAALSVLYLKAREAQLREELTPKVEKMEVIVASQNILKGTKLDASVLAVRSVPVDYVSALALTPAEFGSIEGKVIIQNLGKGNVVLSSFIDEEFPSDFSDTIPLKRRAMTIQVDEVNTISGFIRPGNRIDIFVNLPAGSTGDSNDNVDRIFPVLENVEVLATGQDSAYEYEEKVRLLRGGLNANPDRNFTTLTINVTPKEAALVATSLDKGDLIALLRNREDTSGSRFTEFTPKDLETHAAKLAEEASIREAAAAATGFVMGEDGVLRTKDGVALANQDLVVTKDGTIMTKDGIVLSGRGLTVNEKGELVDAEGNVIDPSKLTVAADGSIITEDGVVLAGGKGLGVGSGGVKLAGTGSVVVNGQVLEGVTRRADGKLVLADGTVVDARDIVVGKDGVVRTKDGKVLDGVKPKGVMVGGQLLEGVTKRADGKLVLADGTVVDPKDVVVGADGVVRTKDGKVLEGVSSKGVVVGGKLLKGVTKRADGKLVLADGTVVDPGDIVIGEDGVVRTKDGKSLAGVTAESLEKKAKPTLVTDDGVVIAGLNINEDGKVVLDDGTVVDPSELVVSSDGKVYTKDGREVSATVGLGVEGLRTDKDGNVIADNGVVIKGAKLNEDGKLVLPDGTVVDPDDVIIQPDGTITTKDGKPIEGLSADTSAVPGLEVRTYNVDYIVGGVSEKGVAEVNKVPVVEDE